MATTTTTTAKPKTERPVERAYREYEARTAKRAARVVRSPRIPITMPQNTVVEIAGHAVVDHTDPDGTQTKTDHQGARGVVVASYESKERGERLASVKCEDGQLRAIPEHRLRRIGAAVGSRPAAAAPAAAPASAGRSSGSGSKLTIGGGDENYRRNWERLFGSKSRSA